MSNSREDSPDWLRAFQVPSHSVLTLSSDSEPSPCHSPTKDNSSDLQRNSADKTSGLLEVDENQDKFFNDGAAETTLNKLSNTKLLKRKLKVRDQTPVKRRKIGNHKKRGAAGICNRNEGDKNIQQESSSKQMEANVESHSLWTLSSDSEDDADVKDVETNEEPSADESSEFHEEEKSDVGFIDGNRESVSTVRSKGKSPKKILKQADHIPIENKNTRTYQGKVKQITDDHPNGKVEGEGGDVDPAEERISEKNVESHVTSSTLPFLLPEKVQRSKALVECEGESIDLSGDMGAVGRVIISDAPSRDPELFLDLKGTIYKTTIVPSRTFCVVSVGQSEAKVEAIMNDFIQLKPQSNVYDAETMVEGTLDGFSFDSEDEADKTARTVTHQNDQNEDVEEQTNQKTEGKSEKSKGRPEKKSGVMQRKAKAAAGKQQKKRKTQASKKGKTKK
ncbi:hypothetical protein Ancab_010119 [Ancistrocladus abbreviatus]